MGNRGTRRDGERVTAHVEQCLRVNREMSASSMARSIVKRAVQMDGKGCVDGHNLRGDLS